MQIVSPRNPAAGRIDDRRRFARELAAIELAFARAAVEEPHLLPSQDDAAVRWALSLARITAVNVPAEEGAPDVVHIGHGTDAYRERLYAALAPAFSVASTDQPPVLRHREVLRAVVEPVRVLARDERRALLDAFAGRLPTAALDRCTRRRPLVVAMGGGGGTAYVYLGALAVLDEAGLVPSLMAGTSMGALIAAFRCRKRAFSLSNMQKLVARLSWSKVFRFLQTESRFGLPATLKLYLREILGHEFQRPQGESGSEFLRMRDLAIPLRICIAGLVNGPKDEEVAHRYEHLLDDVVTDVRRLRPRAATIGGALAEMSKQPVRPIYIGGDLLTQEFDVLDAIGFSSAVPGVIHYDILRDDPRMVELVTTMMRREGVSRLIDGGLADNLPVREALRAVHEGACQERDPFVLALDGFAPRVTARHLLFLPLMRIAAETAKDGRALADLTLTYQHVLSPLSVVPSPIEFARAVENGHKETAPHAPLIRRMVGPIPDPAGIVQER